MEIHDKTADILAHMVCDKKAFSTTQSGYLIECNMYKESAINNMDFEIKSDVERFDTETH